MDEYSVLDAFTRLTSNPSTTYLGTDREQAAFNAANQTGSRAELVSRFPRWPSIENFENDRSPASPSPFANVRNPFIIWDLPGTFGQMKSFGIASPSFQVSEGIEQSFVIFLAAFCNNAMRAKVELYRQISSGLFAKAVPQPLGLDDFVLVVGQPNNLKMGLTEEELFNWQDIRFYSTLFNLTIPGLYKIVVSFDATNYFRSPNTTSNPAGLQFVADIYRQITGASSDSLEENKDNNEGVNKNGT